MSTTVLKATEYLKSEQPSQAAVVLDGLTVLLLSADGERYSALKLLQEMPLAKQRKFHLSVSFNTKKEMSIYCMLQFLSKQFNCHFVALADFYFYWSL